MDIQDLTLRQINELKSTFGGCDNKASLFKVGTKYLIRSVTHYNVGIVLEVSGDFIKLGEASWIADTGNFNNCLKSGEFGEIEPYLSPVIINTGAVVDATKWEHDLPKKVK